jgi:hypothetical protein
MPLGIPFARFLATGVIVKINIFGDVRQFSIANFYQFFGKNISKTNPRKSHNEY